VTPTLSFNSFQIAAFCCKDTRIDVRENEEAEKEENRNGNNGT